MMPINYSKCLKALLLAAVLGSSTTTSAQSVIFPHQTQPGVAYLDKASDTYTLRNALLTAKFKKQNGSLVFGGCPELNLEEGTEIFEIKTGDGSTTVKASQMTLVGEVEEITYQAEPNAVKGAKKLPGKAIQAKFTHGNLSLTWRAVLRDGSHYLRTELELTSNANVKMYSITPMIYSVNVEQAGSAPRVVGNTRGAALLSNKLFAGLETPMGINSVGGAQNSYNFNPNGWTPQSFATIATADVPQNIIGLGFQASHVMVAKGYLSFKKTGNQSITFTYQSGSHKLNIAGVDVRDVVSGNVISSDYHYGKAGSSHTNNVYNISIPNKGVYEVRYYVTTYAIGEGAETITSSGRITYSQSVVAPVLVYDLATGAQPQVKVASTVVSTASADGEFGDGDKDTKQWTTSSWGVVSSENVPPRIKELGFDNPHVYTMERDINVLSKGTLDVEFLYASGSNRLNTCGVDLVNSSNQVVVSDYHIGFTGNQRSNNVYSFAVPSTGSFKLRYFVEFKNENNTSTGNINVQLAEKDTVHFAADRIVPMTGVWSRNTNLLAGETWKVASVVGVVAPDQARRSFLAYSERERAVPWRAMPAYISWYELNIDRNNSPDYSKTMTEEQCTDVVKQWKKNLFDKYNENINSFVWDDGWDFYGPWTFNKNFSNGFSQIDNVARQMNSGIGAWLGPVGGYGPSGEYRRSYWANNGKMQLSNPAYYTAFTKAITDLCNTKGYDFRFFKFDGISAKFSALGPDDGTVGEENAEGIIRAERMVRETIKEDIFFNTSVGTWASPFWFQYTDAIWRQENDYGEIGNQGTDREKWITYRDRLVYQNFVQNSPLCPINTLMTHGFILSRWGRVSQNMDYNGIVRELRCAFACGSGMVELYNDYALMNSINGGRLWGDLAECLRWQKANADVLPDVHWVGGNPWDGAKANVYGWASWNGKKATLALRNPSASAATYTTTLRQALEIPAHVTGSIILNKSFAVQDALPGLTEGQAINIDTQLTLNLPGSSVFVFDGRNSDIPAVATTGVQFSTNTVDMFIGKPATLVWDVQPFDATDKTVTWSTSDATTATVENGVVTPLKAGSVQIAVTTANGQTATITVNISQEPYAVAFDKESVSLNADRYLRSVSITPAGGATTTLNVKNRNPYQDLTDTPVEVPMGAVITPSIDWQGSFMHSYVFADWNNNQVFEAASASSNEVAAFNYYNGQKKGNTGITSQSSNNPGVANIPTFVAPTTPGTYRVRFKVDWDNIDPAGSIVPTNEILKNGGGIVDVLLRVIDPSGIQNATTDSEKETIIHDLSGRRSLSAAKRGVYIINGKKVVK